MAITFTFTGDNKDVLRKLEQSEAAVVKLTQKMREMGDATKKSNKEASDGFSKGIGDLKSFALGFVSVTAGINLVVSAYSNWRQEIQKLGAEHTKFTQNVVREAADAGDILALPQIEKAIQSFGATREQSLALLKGIREAAPTTSLERRLQLGEAAASQAATGTDLGNLGLAVGEISEAVPTKTAGDVVDLATAIRARSGGDFAKTFSPESLRAIGTLVESKAVSSFEEGAALAITAQDANVSAKTVSAIAEVVGLDKATLRTRLKGVSGAAAFTQLTPREQTQQLLQGGAVADKLLGTQEKFAGLIKPEAVQANKEFFERAQATDFAQQQLVGLRASDAGQEAIAEQEAKVEEDLVAQAVGPEAAARARRNRVERARDTAAGPAELAIGEAGRATGWVSSLFGADIGFGAATSGEGVSGGAGFDAVVRELKDIKGNQRRIKVEGQP